MPLLYIIRYNLGNTVQSELHYQVQHFRKCKKQSVKKSELLTKSRFIMLFDEFYLLKIAYSINLFHY